MKTKALIPFLFVFAVLSGCIGKKATDETPTRGSIKISVDESYKPIIDAEISTFGSIYEDAFVHAAYKPEADCFDDYFKDSVRLIITNRKLTPEQEANLKNGKIIPRTTKFAYDAIAFIMNKDNPDSVLTYAQLEAIFRGKINNWSQINKKNETGEINVVFDNMRSGNPRYIKEKFKLPGGFPAYCFAVKSNPEVISYVEKNKNAIGVLSVNWISDTHDSTSNSFLNRIKVAGVSADTDPDGLGEIKKPYQGYIAENSYPFTREVYIISRETFKGLGTGFASFVCSDPGQRIVLKSGLVPATMPVRLINSKR
ncbi:MAG: substrate-binding domain-containing protein [Bacteroidota bacterium]